LRGRLLIAALRVIVTLLLTLLLLALLLAIAILALLLLPLPEVPLDGLRHNLLAQDGGDGVVDIQLEGREGGREGRR